MDDLGKQVVGDSNLAPGENYDLYFLVKGLVALCDTTVGQIQVLGHLTG